MTVISFSTLFQADLSQVWPEANQHFSKEIDDEANSYFQRIYNHPPHPTMSVDEVCCANILFLYKNLTSVALCMLLGNVLTILSRLAFVFFEFECLHISKYSAVSLPLC